LWPFTSDPMAVTRYGALSADDGRSFEIETVRSGKDFLVARLKGIRDRTAAEQLRNLELFVPRDRLPKLADEEFYHADLIGLAVEDHDGTTLGTITAVHNFGAGDLLEIQPIRGGDTVMVPFSADAVPVIDITGRRMVLDPQGVFDVDALLPRAKS